MGMSGCSCRTVTSTSGVMLALLPIFGRLRHDWTRTTIWKWISGQDHAQNKERGTERRKLKDMFLCKEGRAHHHHGESYLIVLV